VATTRAKLKATPEKEDFRGKYESGKVGTILLDGYFQAVRSLLDVTDLKQGRAIEIGCGEGLSTKRLKGMLPDGISLEASEYVGRQIPHAKQNNPGLKVTQESVYELKHKNNSFDLIFLLEVLEHLDFPTKALQEIKRVLKPSGYLILGVPREPLWRFLNVARGKYWHDLGNTPGHLNHWSSKGIKELLEVQFGTVVATRQPIPWTLLLVKNDA
jgi:SAM-dependent methyltransferase